LSVSSTSLGAKSPTARCAGVGSVIMIFLSAGADGSVV
jgi:hypothetical protein